MMLKTIAVFSCRDIGGAPGQRSPGMAVVVTAAV